LLNLNHNHLWFPVVPRKPNDLVLFSIADYMADNYQNGVPVFANAASIRRFHFYKYFMLYKRQCY